MEQNEVTIQLEEIKHIFYNPVYYNWYVVNNKDEAIKIENTEVMEIISQWVQEFPENKWIAKDDALGYLTFKALDIKNLKEIEKIEKEIQELKDKIQSVDLEMNSIREKAKTNFDLGELDKLIPLQADIARLADDRDRKYQQLYKLRSNK